MNKCSSIIILCAALMLMSSFAFAQKDMCLVAREFAAKAVAGFDKNPKKSLAGLMQANKWCPEDMKIAYNLGLAYYRYKRPDKAYAIWADLYKKKHSNKKLVQNLGWLAYKLGKNEEALDWARVMGETKGATRLQLAILFRQGKYEEAMAFAESNSKLLERKDLDQAAEYLVEKQWQQFRSGSREAATGNIVRLSSVYPDSKIIDRAKDKMVLAMWDDSVDIPVPRPLPDSAFNAETMQAASGESEVLQISKIKPTAKPSNKAFAVIVGIHKYQTINGPRFAANDAKQMQRMLTRMCGFKNDQAHIKLLLDNEATLGNMLNSLDWLERKARLNPGAKIIFYFSGHGSPLLAADKTTIKDGLLIPYEAHLDSLNTRTAISLAELDKRFSAIKNKNILTIIDACFSGSGKSASGMKLIKPQVKKELLSGKKQFITASAADRPAEEYAPGRQGAFSYFFLQGMMGPADSNKNGWVDTIEAFSYAKSKLNALDLEQDPRITSNKKIKLSKVR
ncbi:caspase family protein [Maridesulfovibrio salexigens]|uniref:Peptidase C14 caspase catalytic subunit p20 n=1 Tax=Maridesulfovibrio salexigens (strain ATCC 14822 / DSM 2638 / NCIMB 8403 / VKM B-1763) TaxID=526222 RepID=C6BVM2_MARSD|nr:caspase family protein [Maridesulfovibrio salexigens]ACS78236.1 peptidase C14 caspase catalytic subunit p20 [Maridesulfovibrio salexigens DSM 2638]